MPLYLPAGDGIQTVDGGKHLTFLHFGLCRLTNLYTRKRHLVNHSRRLTNSYSKSTNLVNCVEGHLDEELFRIALG